MHLANPMYLIHPTALNTTQITASVVGRQFFNIKGMISTLKFLSCKLDLGQEVYGHPSMESFGML